MPDNTMRITPLEPTAAGAGAQRLAVSRTLVTTVRTEVGRTIPGLPDYTIPMAPLQDGVVYPTTDGIPYYRPVLRVADRRPGLVAGPDVWFQRDAQGALRLEWTLADVPPAGSSGAVPLPTVVTAVRLVWNGGGRAFDAPVQEAVAEAGDGPRLLMHGGAQLLPAEATTLESAMCDAASGCRLEVGLSFTYLSDVVVGSDHIEHPVEATEVVTRVVPFVFNPHDDPNRPIYRSLHGAANLTDEWRLSAAGWLRDSGFPNTVYRLPDELRLAFDPNLGTPHVITTLHSDADDATSVRVLLRVAPWQDPRLVGQVRELVGAPTAQVVVGPVRSATMRLGGSFPESVRTLGDGTDLTFALAGGVDLLMDLSLEYLQLLCGMLGGPVGLPGQAEVTVDQPSGEPVAVSVPVTLRMDTVDDLPVGVEVLESDTGSPTAVRVSNLARTAVRFGGCQAVLVRLQADSVVPLGTYPARCTSPFPVELAAGATVDLTFEQVEPQPDARWNAVHVELLDKAMVEDAEAILLRTNRLAGSGELTWDVVVSSPVFAAATPPQWATLAAVEVELSAPGFDTTVVELRPGGGARTVTMRKPLAELVTGGAGGIRSTTYRVRNNYLDHQGRWGEPQQQSGEELIVYPNPAPGD